MNLFACRKLAWAGALICLLTLQIFAGQGKWQWHTRPDKWAVARNFHTPFEKDYERRISISHEGFSGGFKLKVDSPNKAYWFATNSDSYTLLGKNGAEVSVWSADIPIYIFNERDEPIKIALVNRNPNFVVTIYWINEKLLYIEVWWGRVLGSYLIFDVEKESVIHKEMVHDGNLAFQQWQQAKEK